MTTNPRIEAAARAMHRTAVRDTYCDETPRSLKSVWVDGDVDFYELATAALAAADAAAWRPISEAPHETEVLLFCPAQWVHPPSMEVGCASTGQRVGAYSSMSYHGRATHWQPLPPPPQPDASTER